MGGWAEVGIDAGLYATTLMDRSRDQANKRATAGEPLDPQAVLQQAHSETKVPGSSTACVLALR